MAELIGAASLTRELLPPRRELFRTHYQLALAAQRLLPPMATMDGAFGGIPIPVAWNARYSSQQQAAATSSVEQLGAFGGKVVYLFGALDYLFPLPGTGTCRTSDADAVRAHCRFQLVDDVGHGLEDASGFMPAAIRDRLVEAIDEVNAR